MRDFEFKPHPPQARELTLIERIRRAMKKDGQK